MNKHTKQREGEIQQMNINKNYKQYFTPLDLAEFMVKLIPEDNINLVIDLSMGECGLLEEAKKRWENASYYGADIDETLLSKIHEKSPYIKTFSGDSLGDNITNWKEYQKVLHSTKFDLVIANPPFNYYDQSSVYVTDTESMVLPIEMRFLLKYIDIIRVGGYISIILPYGFLSLDLYKKLRLKILSKVTIIKVIKIFENCFDKIDADTCLILMQKKDTYDRHIQESISIEYLDDTYLLKQSTNITFTANNNRMDLEYHQLLQEFTTIQEKCIYPITFLSDYVDTCKRGRTLTKKTELLTDRGTRFLHTTDVKYLYISNRSPVYVLRNTDYFKESKAKLENILVGRVGKACIGKIAIMNKEYPAAVISDCIFCLSIKNIDPYYLTLYLASKYGQMQLKGLAKGSCSRYITKEDLMQIKVIVLDNATQLYLRKKYTDILSRPGRGEKTNLIQGLVREVEKFLGKE